MGTRGMKKTWSVLLVFCMVVAILGGCSKSNSQSNASPEATQTNKQSDTPSESPSESATTSETENLTKEHVTLKWHFPGNVQQMTDKASVEAEMNKILNKEINASIELVPIDWGAYDQKMNVMSAGGEAFDLVFTAPWSNDYYTNVARGSLLPLDDLLSKYAPKLKSLVPEKVWNATKIKGDIYGAINWQVVAMPYGPSIPKKYVDKYGIDLTTLKTPKDFDPYFAKWDESYAPFLGGDHFSIAPPIYGFDSVGGDTTVGWIRLDDSTLTVVNQYASEQFKDLAETYYRWREKGYIPKDAAMVTTEQRTARNKAGQFEMGTLSSPLKPGADQEIKASWGEDFVSNPVTKPLITTNRAIATMTGISRTSKNPERAMMLLELLSSNKELYRLMSRGIEGKHFKKITEDQIEIIADGGYNPDSDWMFGNQFLGYYTTAEAAAANVWAETEKLNNEAEASPTLGFVFDAEPVKSELAQTESVYQEYINGLLTGTMNPQVKLPEFLDKLSKAGAEKIIAEKQRQVDEWKKNN